MFTHYKKPTYRDLGHGMRLFSGYKDVRTNWLYLIFILLVSLFFARLIVSRIPVYEIMEVNVPIRETEVRVSMYHLGNPAETDSSPCFGASGVDLCQLKKYINICASNCYALGTHVTLEGLGECVVLDRMNKRYGCEIIDWAVNKNDKAWSITKTNVKTKRTSTKSNRR